MLPKNFFVSSSASLYNDLALSTNNLALDLFFALSRASVLDLSINARQEYTLYTSSYLR